MRSASAAAAGAGASADFVADNEVNYSRDSVAS